MPRVPVRVQTSMNQPTLPVDRPHDLPPRWDGKVVLWEGWRALHTDGPVFLCPPGPPQCCPACGSFTPAVTNRGKVATSTLVTMAQLVDEQAALDHLPLSQQYKYRAGRRPLALYGITAFRCPDCRFDQVLDTDGVLWNLDESDYGDAGSIYPE